MKRRADAKMKKMREEKKKSKVLKIPKMIYGLPQPPSLQPVLDYLYGFSLSKRPKTSS